MESMVTFATWQARATEGATESVQNRNIPDQKELAPPV
jgi:hypothetical protein